MIYCRSCARYVDGERPYDSQLCCNLCGRVIEYHNFSSEPTFVKNAAGQSQLSGNFVRTIQSEYGASRERLLERVFDDMQQMRTGVGIGEDDDLVLIAKRLYGMAVDRNFTRGRRTQQVQASCLYYACREKMKPFLLIDFANYLNINVYELGAVYLQLCQVLYLADESNIQKQIDPSIFLPKFTSRLLDGGNKKVCNTARDILASMKRDWITTGRKPSGLCGAALYISALTHGLRFSKSDIVKIAHVCEATLTKRLIEFENTDSGSLTMEDFIAKKELQGSSANKQGSQVSALNEVLCKHKNSGKPFAYGLCRSCYDEFMTISEGLEGGSDPPAFQLAERERMAKASEEKNTSFERELQSPFMITAEKMQSTEPESVGKLTLSAGTVARVLGAGTKQAAVNECDHNKSPGVDFTIEASDGSDNFSDIDDLEVDGYLHNEEEKHYKKIIWEKMNWEYLEEQAAKEAAAAAAKEAFEANYKNCPKDLQGAQELAAAAAAAVAKSRKERQQKRAVEARNSAPPRTAVEAAQQMLTKKRLSAKINLNVLKELFGDSVDPETPKKKRTESHTDDNDNLTSSGKQGHEQRDTFKKGNLETEYYYDNKLHTGEACEDQLDYEIGNETYGYDDDYGCDGY